MGLSPVSYASNLEALAMQRAKELVTNYSHDGIIGKNVGFENIQINYTDDYIDWFTTWEQSALHAENMFDPNMTSCVVGIFVQDGTYYLSMIGDCEVVISDAMQAIVNATPEEKEEVVANAVESGQVVQIGSTDDGDACDWYVDAEGYCSQEQLEESTGLTQEQIEANANALLESLGLAPGSF